MYSVVLVMAMTSGGDLPDLGHRHGGCCGGYSSCCGGYSGGYSCCGGYSGCCGGGYVDYCGCCGGGRHHHHRHGGYSCCGGGYSCCGGGYYGGYSGCCGGYYGGYSCTGGMIYDGGAVYGPGGPAYGPGGVIVTQPGTTPEPVGKPGSGEKKPEVAPPPKPEVLVPTPATIIVSLPADAKLTIDDAGTASTSSLRVFTSPNLPVGRDFHYTLKADFNRDGKPMTLSKDITVRAGEETRVNLDDSVAGVASR